MAPLGPARHRGDERGQAAQHHLRSRPLCRAKGEAGLVISEYRRWQADITVSCLPPGPDLVEPRLIVQVLSPSTRSKDLAEKLPDYKAPPSVTQVWLIDSERRWPQVWWREAEGWHGRNHLGSASFRNEILEVTSRWTCCS
jgi:Uma2 family endonuclease